MKFKIYTTRHDYQKEIIDPHLLDLGFTFKVIGKFEYRFPKTEGDEMMRIQPHAVEIEINSLEELVDLQEKVGELIIKRGKHIEIYNDTHWDMCD